MKAAILALLAVAVTTIEEAQAEMRDRLCEPTNLKFEALKRDLNTAIVEGVNEPEEVQAVKSPDLVGQLTEMMGGTDPVTLMRGLAEQISIDLGERVALIVHAALEESEAKTA